MTDGLEVGARAQADFERAIIQGFAIFRDLRAITAGLVDFDAGILNHRRSAAS